MRIQLDEASGRTWRLVSHSTLTFAVGYNTQEGKRIIAGGPATMAVTFDH